MRTTMMSSRRHPLLSRRPSLHCRLPSRTLLPPVQRRPLPRPLPTLSMYLPSPLLQSPRPQIRLDRLRAPHPPSRGTILRRSQRLQLWRHQHLHTRRPRLRRLRSRLQPRRPCRRPICTTSAAHRRPGRSVVNRLHPCLHLLRLQHRRPLRHPIPARMPNSSPLLRLQHLPLPLRRPQMGHRLLRSRPRAESRRRGRASRP